MIVTVSAAIERQAPYADKQIGVRLFRVLVRVVTYIRQGCYNGSTRIELYTLLKEKILIVTLGSFCIKFKLMV